ncbi:MAG: FAD-binding protein, partial [Rhodospirillaceae bacterium]|nr:FAD-binding protein [Rhodospirillaceae bacterium]
MKMPKPDGQIIDRRREIIDALARILPGEGLIVDEEELRAYECDGLMAYRQLPLVVALPETTEQISQILSYCQNAGVKIVPRGAGTGLSGGALPLADGITIGLGKFNRILDVDFENRAVVA